MTSTSCKQDSRFVDRVFWGGVALSLALFQSPLLALARLVFEDERYSYIAAVPFISAFLIWLKRDRVRTTTRPYRHSFSILIVTLLIACAALVYAFFPYDPLGAETAWMVLTWLALGAGCYGIASLRVVLFPALFLFLLIPLPGNVMDASVINLQRGSAEMTEHLFRLIGMPFSRDGFTFALPGVNIVVAEQCSGIRSSLSMLICAILAGHLFLKSGWNRVGFALLAIPVVIFKNAVRIVTISWLGVRVDPGYFTGYLHHYGGLPFTLLVLAIMVPVFLGLQKWENHRTPAAHQ